MAVAHDAVSESHTGTAGSTNQASFSWTHTPAGTPKGVLVMVYVNIDTAGQVLGVTYGGANLALVAEAVDSAGESARTQAWFLGSAVPTGPATVVVNRNTNAVVMYAVCATQTAAADTEATGAVLLQGDSTLAEQAVNDGSPGTNSVRYAGVNSGLAAVPAAGANSTTPTGIGIDFGTRVVGFVRETTAGQGARPVGFSSGTADDVAAVHIAVREVVPAGPTFASVVSGVGTVTAAATKSAVLAAVVAGTGVVTSGLRKAASIAGAVSGVGAVAASIVQSAPVTFASAVSGAGSLAAGLRKGASSAAAVVGTGALASSLRKGALSAAAVAGTGAVTAGLTVGARSIAVAITGTGAVAAGLSKQATTVVQVAGSGAVSAVVRTARSFVSLVAGSGSVGASIRPVTPGRPGLTIAIVPVVGGSLKVSVAGASAGRISLSVSDPPGGRILLSWSE